MLVEDSRMRMHETTHACTKLHRHARDCTSMHLAQAREDAAKEDTAKEDWDTAAGGQDRIQPTEVAAKEEA